MTRFAITFVLIVSSFKGYAGFRFLAPVPAKNSIAFDGKKVKCEMNKIYTKKGEIKYDKNKSEVKIC